MAEEVNTGGLIRFQYGKDSSAKLSDSERNEIRGAYARADERKRKERLKRWVIWIVIGLIVIGGLAYLILK
jgi:hypothetical protein